LTTGSADSIPPPEGTVTLMFTDIVGSTALRDAFVAVHGDNLGDQLYRDRLLNPHDTRISGLLVKHRGFEVKRIGDSFMAAFAAASDAILCAVEIQRSLRDDPVVTEDPNKPLAVRIGMHTGAATLVRPGGKVDYDGHTVNIAARVEGLLKTGERVYCSGQTAAVAKTGSATGIVYHSYGIYTLKGVASDDIEIFDVLWNDGLKPDPPRQERDRLPTPWLTPWIGREREAEELREALRANKLVTLHGMGGVGKTRLAVETLLDNGASIPRDLVFVPLEEGIQDTTDGVFAAVRNALALTEVDAPDLVALCKHLTGGDRLLILDNFETVMKGAKVAARLASIAGVRVLVTSQQTLGVSGECVVEVDPLPTDGELLSLESYQLFACLARQKDARWQPEDGAAMCEVLAATDGLPYLIELVAAVAPKRQLRQLAEELKTHLTAVRVRSGGAPTERHEGVQACLEWAMARLPPDERSALPRLAIFAGSFNSETAETIADTTLSSLDVLVDASLLRFSRERGRYSILPTTRRFARDLIDDEEHKSIATRHARWFIERLDRADDAIRAKGGDAQHEARSWIDSELENIQQAIGWAERVALDLFERAVPAFGIYLGQRYRFSEAVRLQEALLSSLSLESAPQAWAQAQNNLGAAYWELPTGDREENLTKAISCFEAALRFFTEADLPMQWAMTQNNLGIAHSDLVMGDRGENLTIAIAHYNAALRVYTESDFPEKWAMAKSNLGTAYADLPTGNRSENLIKAVGCFEASLRVTTEWDFPIDWAGTQHNLGVAYGKLTIGDRNENLTKAIGCFEASLRVRTERDFPMDWAKTQNSLGIAYTALLAGHSDENLGNAITHFEAALRVLTERESPVNWAMTQNNLGIAYSSRSDDIADGDLNRAIDCFLAAERGYLAVGETQRAEMARKRAKELSR
jgi:class 3 adenylate cyclase/predicted ATPase